MVIAIPDVAFVKPFDLSASIRDGKVRLFRRNDDRNMPQARNTATGRAIGQGRSAYAPEDSPHDYMSTLIAWRRETVRRHVRAHRSVTGEHWVEAIGATGNFSECTLYGRYVDEIIDLATATFTAAEELCQVRGRASHIRTMAASIDGVMSPDQVAIGMQSFIGTA